MGAPPPSAIRLRHHLPIHRHRLLAAATFTTEPASLATTTTDLTTTTILPTPAAAAVDSQVGRCKLDPILTSDLLSTLDT